MKREIIITFDIDWASEEIIEYALTPLVEAQLPFTCFLTHISKYLSGQAAKGRCTLGIHPNFRTNSSHGKTEEEVIKHCLTLGATEPWSRSHGLHFSTPIMFDLVRYGITHDFSTYIPLTERNLSWVHPLGLDKMWRHSYNWEDDSFFYYENQSNFFSLDLSKDYPLFCDFHPIHVALNSHNTVAYEVWKQGSRDLEHALKLRQPGSGAATLMDEIIRSTKAGECTVLSLKDYVQQRVNQ